MNDPAPHHPHHPHPNGSKKVFAWVAVVLGGVAVIFIVAMVGSAVNNASEIRMLNMRMFGVEQSVKELQQEIRKAKP